MNTIVAPIRMCSVCHACSDEVRILRGKQFVLIMCDECALSNMPVDRRDERLEYRVQAVAIKALALAS